jgi:3-(3-hydroxy-phenyl)propionate hydroxylase
MRPLLPEDRHGLRHLVVSRWDAPLDSGIRDRSLFDDGDLLRLRVGCDTDTVVLIRPDDHIAALMPIKDGLIDEIYDRIVYPT